MSDSDIIAVGESKFANFVPITLANRYKWVPEYCEIKNSGFCGYGRRPVIMRGSVGAMIAAYAFSQGSRSANGYVAAVIKRALRMSRATFLKNEEFLDWRDRVFSKISKKYRTTGHIEYHLPSFYHYHFPEYDKYAAVICGKFVSLRGSEYENIRALHNIVKKTERLDKRRELVLAHMSKRLAA